MVHALIDCSYLSSHHNHIIRTFEIKPYNLPTFSRLYPKLQFASAGLVCILSSILCSHDYGIRCLIPWLFAPGLSLPYPSSRLMIPHTATPAPMAVTTVLSAVTLLVKKAIFQSNTCSITAVKPFIFRHFCHYAYFLKIRNSDCIG